MRATEAAQSTQVAGTYVVLDTAPTYLALRAEHVLGIDRADDWKAETPRSLIEIFPISFSAAHPTWVLTLYRANDLFPILFSGKIRMSQLHSDSLLSMTTLKYAGFDAFSDLVLTNGKPLALVVNIDTFFTHTAN